MSQPAGQTANADQYDLGSTATDQTAPPTTPPAGDVAAQPGAPLRRSDGTFLPKHSHPDRLVRQARDLGFSDEDIATASTAELRADVTSARLEQLVSQRSETVNAALERNPVPPPAPAAPASPAQEVPELSDEYDDNIRKMAGVLKDALARVKALEEGVGEIKGFHQAQANKTLTEQCDAFFAKDAARFGKGTVDEVKEDSPEYARRMAVIEQAKKFDKNLPVAAKLQKAYEILYGASAAPAPPPPTKEPTRATPTPEEWREAGLARPTRRQPDVEPEGPKKAVRAVQQYFEENGVGRDEPGIADEFPG
jgi:hypothetical protein